jgi:predicted TIM-barrel fold metal-dependent hydrolase
MRDGYTQDKNLEALGPQINIPTFKTVMDEQFNMFKNHPNTTFINAHMGWMANDLNKLEDHLDNLP